jgi:hypothetical protein
MVDCFFATVHLHLLDINYLAMVDKTSIKHMSTGFRAQARGMKDKNSD